MAASEADRDLIFYTFNHEETVNSLNKIIDIIEAEKLKISDIYKLVMDYYNEIFSLTAAEMKVFNLVEYLKTKFNK